MSRRRLSIASTIERAAQALPDVTCGVACKGTTLEARTFATGKKTFLFVGAKDARLKLADSAKEASALADAVRVGAGGWTRISLEGDVRLTPAVLTRWVEESYRLVVGPAVGRPASRPPKKR